MSYKKWMTPWKLHSRQVDNMDWIEKPLIGRKWLFLAGVILAGTMYEAHADFTTDRITMDVTMVNGTSGTYLCPSARECYVKSLEYEARGGHQYCVSLVMKRNGKVIWWRKYR